MAARRARRATTVRERKHAYVALPAPQVVIVAGPNGAGKTTLADSLLRKRFGELQYVNADPIARGLSAFQPETVAIEAGRAMLMRLRTLADEGKSFAFESTLATRFYAQWIKTLKNKGYRFHLLYLWLHTPDLAVQRVQERVRTGGHNVPEKVVRRRYTKGIANFFELYQRLANSWAIYDNSVVGRPAVICYGSQQTTKILEEKLWQKFQNAGK